MATVLKARSPARAANRLIDPFEPAEIKRLVAQFGSPLLIIDCERIRQQYLRLQAALPGIDLHYALKPLPHPAVVAALAQLGAGFDLASSGEVGVVRELGIAPARCVHTHPIKRDSDIRDALEFGVDTFVADNPDEIAKFTRYRGQAQLLLRISFRSPDAVCDLSRKFGCEPGDAGVLLKESRRLGVRVRGFSFHVGSQATDPAKHVEATAACVALIEQARRDRIADIDMLDIGGGFPVDYMKPVEPIEEFCAPIRAALRSVPKDVRIIAEPGRYIAAPAAIGVATVIGRARRDDTRWYYLDDGLYGSYSGQLFDHARYPLESLRQGEPRFASVVAGPTCDSIDVINENIALPELRNGDLVIGRAMGAYTWASASDFNFFPKARVVSVNLNAGDTGTVMAVRK